MTVARISDGRSEITTETLDKGEERALDLLVAATVGWKGVVDGNGEPVPLTPESARAFYKAFPIARDQADLFIGNRANFTLESSKG